MFYDGYYGTVKNCDYYENTYVQSIVPEGTWVLKASG